MISPQSQSVLDRLDNGERVTSGSESVGPLDVPTRRLLRLLVEEGDVLNRESGAEQARKLRKLNVEAKCASEQLAEDATGECGIESDGTLAVKNGATESSGEVQAVASDQPVVEGQPARWRLHDLTCRSVRGVDPSGEPLEFPFNGLPALIYGPNGSGKSSLLGAITWILTGRIITDADDDAEHATLYGVPRAGAGRGAKIRDWPVVAALPQAGNPAVTAPECSAELQLQSSVRTLLWVRRSLSDGLETSHDGSTWTSCGSLVQHGIEPLDLQLSLIAPTVFGRLTIERADDTRSLLSLMLGYDELETFGDFVSKIAGNRRRLETHEQNELDTKWTELQQKLESLPGNLPKDSDLRKRLDVLAATKKPTQEAISEIGKAVKLQIKTAETNLASLLGIVEEGEDASPPDGLADKLTTVIAALEKGVWETFPSLSAIRVEVALPEKDGEDTKTRFAGILKETNDLLSSSKTRIAERLNWWRKEVEPASKAALLLRAA